MKFTILGYTFSVSKDETEWTPEYDDVMEELRSPLCKISTAGRVAIAGKLVAAGKIKTPEQYLELLEAKYDNRN